MPIALLTLRWLTTARGAEVGSEDA